VSGFKIRTERHPPYHIHRTLAGDWYVINDRGGFEYGPCDSCADAESFIREMTEEALRRPLLRRTRT